MENLMQKETVMAHNPKPKINDTLGIHFCIICAKMLLAEWIIKGLVVRFW